MTVLGLPAGAGTALGDANNGQEKRMMNPISKDIPKAKETIPGLYVTAAEAYAQWQADPEHVFLLDVRTPEEHFWIGHAPMAWKIPLVGMVYEWDAENNRFPTQPLPDFVERVRSVLKPGDKVMAMCRSGGRSAMAVNALAKAGLTNVYNIIDGFEGDAVEDPGSVFAGQRLRNGWKNSGCPWTCTPTPERMVYPHE
jgi:rhodanese-related sulfurtransferase